MFMTAKGKRKRNPRLTSSSNRAELDAAWVITNGLVRGLSGWIVNSIKWIAAYAGVIFLFTIIKLFTN